MQSFQDMKDTYMLPHIPFLKKKNANKAHSVEKYNFKR